MRLVRFGRRTVDLSSGEVSGEGAEHLSPIESRLLRYLFERKGQIVSRDELLTEVWAYRAGIATRTIDNTVRRLRLKVEDNPSDPRFLQSIYGRGLRLDAVEIVDDTRLPLCIGRDDEIARAGAALLRSPLVTLTGPGGIGKTCLAQAIAARSRDESVYVSCSTVRTATDLDQQLLIALGTSEAPLRALQGRGPLLLILDECEQAIAPISDRVSTWLSSIPNLKILATSRIALGLPLEHVIILDPLSVQSATQLFVERVARRDPRFPVEKEAVQRIAALLDGVPLAIELASVRAPVLGLDRLESLLSGRLDVLEAHGTSMAAILDRSWQLCSADDRRLLALLSTFSSTFDLDDIAAIAELPQKEALRAVESLATQSLLSLVPGPPLRYRLLAPIRDRAKADLSSDDPATLRWARWIARLGEPSHLERARGDYALRANLRASVPDLVRALEFLRDPDPEAAVRCALALMWWHVREGSAEQGLPLSNLPLPRSTDPRVRAGIAVERATLLTAAGLFEETLPVIEAALRESEDPMDTVMLLCALASASRNLGDLASTQRALDQGLPLVDQGRAAQARFWFLRASFHGEGSTADFRKALETATRSGERHIAAMAIAEIAERTSLKNGDWPAARRAYLEALAQLGPERNRYARMSARQTLLQLGRLEQLVGDLEAAESYLEQALEIATSDPSIVARAILARTWSQAGQHDDALSLIEPVTSGRMMVAVEPLALACIAHAECLIRIRREELALPLIDTAKENLRHGAWPYLQAELCDLIAFTTLDTHALEEATSKDSSAIGTARRAAIRSAIASRLGDRSAAERALREAQGKIRALSLLPSSDASLWASYAQTLLESVDTKRP